MVIEDHKQFLIWSRCLSASPWQLHFVCINLTALRSPSRSWLAHQLSVVDWCWHSASWWICSMKEAGYMKRYTLQDVFIFTHQWGGGVMDFLKIPVNGINHIAGWKKVADAWVFDVIFPLCSHRPATQRALKRWGETGPNRQQPEPRSFPSHSDRRAPRLSGSRRMK